METKPKVTIGGVDEEFQSGITWSSSPNKSFGNLSILNNVDKTSPDFATLELNEYLLGSQFDKNISNVSFMSDGLSNEECIFGNQWVEGVFPNPINFDSLFLDFGSNFPKSIKIEFFSGNLLKSEKTIDEVLFNSINIFGYYEGISKIRVTFLESWSPYNYAHLQTFIIGNYLEFSGDDIVDLKIVENADPISNRLEIDTARVEILNRNKTFNLLDPADMSNILFNEQKISIYVYIDNEEKLLGVFYTKKLTYGQNNNLIIECESFLGLMSRAKYYSSKLLYLGSDPNYYPSQGEGVRFCDVVEDIFKTVLEYFGVDPNDHLKYYSIDNELKDIVCCGYIGVTDCREALRIACFNIGAMVVESRNKKISIKKYKPTTSVSIEHQEYFDYKIPPDKIISEPTFEVLSTIYGYGYTKNSYTINQEEKRREGGYVVLPGDRWMPWEEEKSGWKVLRVEPSGLNYESRALSIKIKSNNNPETIFASIVFNELETDEDTKNIYMDNYGKNSKFIKFPKCPMFTFKAKNILSESCEFLNSHNIKLKISYINTGEQCGKKIFFNLLENNFFGVLSHQTIDVAHGMVASAEILGSNKGI